MPKKFQKGLFALSADPITYGHLATIKLALKQCQKLVVLVANNEEKKSAYTFSLAKRFALTKQAVVQANLTGVQVVVSSGLLTDVFMKEGCDVVFRGIRHEYDYSYEVEKSKLYAHIYPAVKKRFVFLTTPEKYSHVSSSWVKDFVKMGVNVAPYVPLFIKQALEEKMCGQIKIGVTGTLGSGKSFVARQLIGALQKKKIKAYHIVLDDLLHKLYAEDSEGAQTIRQDLAKKFGTRVLSKDKKTVNRAQLAQKLFAEVRNKKTVEWAQTLVYPQVERLLREEIAGKKGVIFVEWAQFAEMNMLSWVNNNLILVSSKQQELWCKKRQLSAVYIKGCQKLQWSTAKKARFIQNVIKKDHCGKILEYQNNTPDQICLPLLQAILKSVR